MLTISDHSMQGVQLYIYSSHPDSLVSFNERSNLQVLQAQGVTASMYRNSLQLVARLDDAGVAYRMWSQHAPLLPPHLEWPVCGSPGGYLPATVEDSIFIFGLRHNFSGQLFSHGFFTFPTQSKAFEFADSHRHMCLMLFAEETSSQGQRRFAAAPATTFWLAYSKLEPSQRHWYEVIREGTPCHLYFDVEFQVANCPGWDGDLMVGTLMNAVQELLMAWFGLSLPMQSIFELDSTTTSKFSRHLVVTLDQVAWLNNMHVGAFVTQVMAYLHESRHEPRFECFFANDKSAFVDLSVYTANRT
jgi:hypothetical protein